jgi:hypothetical protein
MVLITTYKVKPYLGKEETKKLLEVFTKKGPGRSTTAHYAAADGSHGVVIADSDDVAAVMLTIEQAVPRSVEARDTCASQPSTKSLGSSRPNATLVSPPSGST